MIYTVTLNPSIDYIIETDKFKIGEVNRANKEELYPGGKGINVSLMLNELQVENTALGFLGGFIGEYIENTLASNGVNTEFIKLEKGFSRINLKIKNEVETEINGKGPHISEDNLQLLYKKIEKLKDEDILVLCGSIPKSLSNTLYQDIISMVAKKNVKVIVDATSNLLLNTLKYNPFLIKPNIHELEEIFDTKIDCIDSTIFYATKLKDMGAENVLISMGKDGALLIDSKGKIYLSNAPYGDVVNTVGSGDSMVAGFISGYLKTKDYKEALKLGASCGSATAFSSGIGEKKLIDTLKNEIEIKEICK
ncbi:MAG: 1-phosphofructokinase [Intestinibacter bartlettii]|uniref:1-phosphofructokinase n=1 Tax=Intestinibacter bartlettii TaxID=261299 RepID=UPI00248C60F0|nr:1-phosphofructokinase [Intestinibacter bartlettii]MEE0616683.1 1-phosphofructokinase [Intestinibacter bartlettii]